MTLALTQSFTAVAANITSSFMATGGTAPYAFSVSPGGAGGTIDPSTGVYTAPGAAQSDPKLAYDTILVTDSATPTPSVVAKQILVGTPLMLFCDIIQKEMGLANGRVILWDQKLPIPTDSNLFIAVSVPFCRAYGNSNAMESVEDGGLNSVQSVNIQASVDIDIISRGPDARDRKEQIVLALASIYSQQQQEANSFKIARLPPSGSFVNLSQIDGAAIPYRFKISIFMLYAVTKTTAAQFFDTFQEPSVTTNE